MRHATMSLVLTVFVGLLAGCAGEGKVPRSAVAIVDGRPITQRQFDELVRSHGAGPSRTVRRQAMQYLVQRAEVEQEAEKQGITVGTAEIADRLATLEKQYFGGSEQRYRTQLKRQGLTDAQVRDNIRSTLTQEKIFKRVTRNVTVTDAEVKRHYERHRSQYEPARRNAFSRVKGLIRRQLLQEKRSDAMKQWWQKLTQDFEGKVSCRNATDCVFLHRRT